MADVVRGFGDGGKVLFLPGPVDGRPFVARRFDRWPFPGRGFDRRRFRKIFLRHRFEWFVCSGRRRGSGRGTSAGAASTSTASAPVSGA